MNHERYLRILNEHYKDSKNTQFRLFLSVNLGDTNEVQREYIPKLHNSEDEHHVIGSLSGSTQVWRQKGRQRVDALYALMVCCCLV